MRWIKRKVRQWANEDESKPVVDQTVGVDDSPVLNFRIFSAQNGLILEFTRYNSKIDRRDNSIYIIANDEDVADFVRQTLPMEMLKVQQ